MNQRWHDSIFLHILQENESFNRNLTTSLHWHSRSRFFHVNQGRLSFLCEIPNSCNCAAVLGYFRMEPITFWHFWRMGWRQPVWCRSHIRPLICLDNFLQNKEGESTIVLIGIYYQVSRDIFHSFRNEPLSAWGRYHNIDVIPMSVSACVCGLSLSQSPTPRKGSFTPTVCECDRKNVFMFLSFLCEWLSEIKINLFALPSIIFNGVK